MRKKNRSTKMQNGYFVCSFANYLAASTPALIESVATSAVA